MKTAKTPLLPPIEAAIKAWQGPAIAPARQKALQALIDYGKQKMAEKQAIRLNFICTHNSRRSQFAQIWAQSAAAFFAVPCHCYSGGVEVTAFNPRAVQSLKKSGFKISGQGQDNPYYQVIFSEEAAPLQAFSKRYDHPNNPKENFAAIMTCSHANEHCPFIPGAEKRIALNYQDPKDYDGTAQEAEKYHERSQEIAREMCYVFEKISL